MTLRFKGSKQFSSLGFLYYGIWWHRIAFRVHVNCSVEGFAFSALHWQRCQFPVCCIVYCCLPQCFVQFACLQTQIFFSLAKFYQKEFIFEVHATKYRNCRQKCFDAYLDSGIHPASFWLRCFMIAQISTVYWGFRARDPAAIERLLQNPLNLIDQADLQAETCFEACLAWMLIAAAECVGVLPGASSFLKSPHKFQWLIASFLAVWWSQKLISFCVLGSAFVYSVRPQCKRNMAAL